MQDATSDSYAAQSAPMLTPTEALLRGFEFETRADGGVVATTASSSIEVYDLTAAEVLIVEGK